MHTPTHTHTHTNTHTLAIHPVGASTAGVLRRPHLFFPNTSYIHMYACPRETCFRDCALLFFFSPLGTKCFTFQIFCPTLFIPNVKNFLPHVYTNVCTTSSI